MRIMKNIIACVVTLFIITGTITVHASDEKVNELSDFSLDGLETEQLPNDMDELIEMHKKLGHTVIIADDSGTSTRSVANCPYGNGICQAVSSGRAFVYIGSSLVINGTAWQCENCHTVYATQYNPLRYNLIGNYAVAAFSEPIPSSGTAMFVDSISYTDDNTLEGVSFQYQ